MESLRLEKTFQMTTKMFLYNGSSFATLQRKADLAWSHTCRSPAGQGTQPLLSHQNHSLIQAIKVNSLCIILAPTSFHGWAESVGGWMEGQVLLVSDLLTCCSRRRVFMAVRSFWQIWQKNKPASSRLARASSLHSCWRAKARAVSCSMDGRWWESGREDRDKMEGDKPLHLSLLAFKLGTQKSIAIFLLQSSHLISHQERYNLLLSNPARLDQPMSRRSQFAHSASHARDNEGTVLAEVSGRIWNFIHQMYNTADFHVHTEPTRVSLLWIQFTNTEHITLECTKHGAT